MRLPSRSTTHGEFSFSHVPLLCCAAFHDEAFRLFAVSTLVPSIGVLPQCRTLIFPLAPCEPKSMCRVWAASWCAEREAGVGAMRANKDLPLDV